MGQPEKEERRQLFQYDHFLTIDSRDIAVISFEKKHIGKDEEGYFVKIVDKAGGLHKIHVRKDVPDLLALEVEAEETLDCHEGEDVGIFIFYDEKHHLGTVLAVKGDLDVDVVHQGAGL